MANKKNWLGMLVIALALGMMVIGCSARGLTGKWVIEDGSIISLNISHFELSSDGNGQLNGNTRVSWTAENERLLLTTTGLGNMYTYDYKLSGKRLTLTNDRGISCTFVKEDK